MSDFPRNDPADFGDAHIPEHLRELVNAELVDNETIQWMEQPTRAFIPFESVLLLFFMSLIIPLLVGFLFFFACGAVEVLQRNLFGFAATSLITAFSITFSVWQTANRSAKQVVYVITDFRAMIIYGTSSVLRVMSYYPTELSYLSRVQKANGTGHLYFRAGLSNRDNALLGLMNIRHVKEVERMLQELKRTQSPEKS